MPQDAVPDPRATSPLKISEIILKTGRMDEMKAFYRIILDLDPFFEHAPADGTQPLDLGGQTRAADLRMCFFRVSLEYPYTQMIGIFQEPGVGDQVAKERPGLHHMQFMTSGIDELCAKFEALRDVGLRPHRSSDHGPMTSFYYRDPDGNNVELTAQNFATLDEMVAFMASDEFLDNPSGEEIDPDAFVARRREGSVRDCSGNQASVDEAAGG